MSGDTKFVTDSNWSTPMIDLGERERFDKLNYSLYTPGFLCTSNGSQYVFVDIANSWCNLASPTTTVRVCSMMDVKNATVNYDIAFRPYIDYLLKRCDAKVAKTMPTSVCIATRRLEIIPTEAKRTLRFEICRSLVEIAPNFNEKPIPSIIKQSIEGLCVMPVATSVFLEEYTFPGVSSILNFLHPLFHDSRDMFTLLWHIGNCLVDPVLRPKSLMLVGQGGSGKSTVMQVIYSVLRGCSGVLPDGTLTARSSKMPSDVAEVIVSSRMAICYDVGLDNDNFNMSVFKNISGSDYIRVGFHSCKTFCSLTFGSNHLIDIEKQTEYTDDAIMRRLVVLNMNVNALDIPQQYALKRLKTRWIL